MTLKTRDNASVGVLIRDVLGRFLVFDQATCGAAFEDRDGITLTCERAAPYWFHIHRDGQVWFVPAPGGIFYRHFGKTRCPECGQNKPDVTTDRDPFAWELDGEDIPMRACGDCFQRRHEDI